MIYVGRLSVLSSKVARVVVRRQSSADFLRRFLGAPHYV